MVTVERIIEHDMIGGINAGEHSTIQSCLISDYFKEDQDKESFLEVFNQGPYQT
jgi:hypothetical protein